MYFFFFLWTGTRKWSKRDKYLTDILLVAAEKALTRKWLSSECPTQMMWMDITMDIYKKEKLTAHVNFKKDLFASRCKKWMDYVTPH